MRLNHHFLLMMCVLFCAQIIQADLIHGLLGFGETDNSRSGTNNTPGGSVSPSSPNNVPNTPSLPEASTPANNNNDKPSNNDSNNSPSSAKTPSAPVQSSSPTIPPPPLSNSPPSPLSSPVAPVSSNIDSSAPAADATPSAQPNKNSPPTTTTPNSSTNDPNDNASPSKNHSSDGGGSSNPKNNNDSKGKNNNESSSNSVTNVTSSTEPDDPGASNTPESNHHNSTGTIAGTVLGGIVGLALIGGIVTWCNRKGGCTKRQKNGERDGGFKQTDNYSIDMHPHAASTPGIKSTTDLCTSTGMMEMTPASPFDHSRRLVAGVGPPSGTVPAYTDTHYHEQQVYEQDYQGQQLYNHHDGVPAHHEDIPGDGTGYYYQQDYDQQQHHSNYSDYYQPDTYKPDAVDHHNYKPNAI